MRVMSNVCFTVTKLEAPSFIWTQYMDIKRMAAESNGYKLQINVNGI